MVRKKNSEGKGQKKDSATPRQRKQSGSKLQNLGEGTVAGPRQNVGARRPPKSSAVTITGQSENFSYADAIKKAREGISLKDLQIKRTKIRKANNGSLLIEVMGPNGAGKPWS